ncbi:MAG TPA: hypothetical protein VKO35_01140 [Acidimicrobiia bacterium]|nr:hypothetical protein [Acidimicrobiia bacterium]
MSAVPPDEPERGFEVFGVRGNPTAEEEAAVLEAIEELLVREQRGEGPVARTSAWKLAGRLAARRGGILDSRTSLGGATWAASARLPWTGRAYGGRTGRGDSR